jgi:hypothetical protein
LTEVQLKLRVEKMPTFLVEMFLHLSHECQRFLVLAAQLTICLLRVKDALLGVLLGSVESSKTKRANI